MGKKIRNSRKKQKLEDPELIDTSCSGLELPMLLRVHLPSEVIHAIFGEYLTMMELLEFDKACTNYKARKRYMQFILKFVGGQRPPPEYRHTVKSLTWCSDRGLSLRAIRLKRSERNISNELVMKIKSRSLTDVSLAANTKMSATAFSRFCENNPQLTHINIDGTKLKNKSIVTLGRACARLESLSVAMCPAIGDRGVGELGRHCSELLHLDLHNTSMTDAGVLVIADSCPSLKLISLANVQSISDVSIIALAAGCPHLQSIDLSENSSSYWRASSITDESLHAIAQNCPSLKYANFSDCNTISLDGIVAVIRKCEEIERIYISNCGALRSDWLPQIANVINEYSRSTLKMINVSNNDAAIDLEDATTFKHRCPYVLLNVDLFDRGLDLRGSPIPAAV